MPPTKEQIKICLSVAVLILQKVENNIRKGMTIKFTSDPLAYNIGWNQNILVNVII